MVAPHFPQQGDIVLLNFNPQAGHEQQGTRPALVASNPVFHQLTKLAIVCPITSVDRGFPLHVRLDSRTKTRGVVMCEQAKSLDVNARGVVFVERAPREVADEVSDVLVGSVERLQGLGYTAEDHLKTTP